MPERRGGHPRGNNYYAFKRGYKSVDFPLWINVMSSLCYLRKLFDKNVASGTSIIFSINARVKKKISIPITRASWKKKTITKDCRGYNYKKKMQNTKFRAKRIISTNKYARTLSYRRLPNLWSRSPKRLGAARLWNGEALRVYIYIRKRRKKKKKLAEKKKIAKKLETPLAKRGRVDRRNKGGLVANINRRTRY